MESKPILSSEIGSSLNNPNKLFCPGQDETNTYDRRVRSQNNDYSSPLEDSNIFESEDKDFQAKRRKTDTKFPDCGESSDPDINMSVVPFAHNFPVIVSDDLSPIKSILQIHDSNYKSISFGEELIKEMVISSVSKIPLSPSATMTAYRLMVQRVTRVAQGLDSFINLSHKTQSLLLKNNSDLVVSLRGAVFFEKRKGGLDQILISMGVDDLFAAMKTVSSAMKKSNLQRIDYSTFNTVQKVGNSESEKRYNELLERIGATLSVDMDLVKILTFILIFSTGSEEIDAVDWKGVVKIRDVMINMMERYISVKYPKEVFPHLLPEVFNCIGNLQELTWIKKQRQLASHTQAKAVYEPSNASKSKSLHFNS